MATKKRKKPATRTPKKTTRAIQKRAKPQTRVEIVLSYVAAIAGAIARIVTRVI